MKDDRPAASTGEERVRVHILAKSSERLDMFTLSLVDSLQMFTINNGIEIPFSLCHTFGVFGGSGEDELGE